MKQSAMSKKIILVVLSAFLMVNYIHAQPKGNTPEETYQWRIKQKKLHKVYIPADLAECFSELDLKISKTSKAKFLSIDENTAMKKLHYSLGKWIWYNWGFYDGSRLTVYMNKMGIYHPEDMADFIIMGYHRYLKKSPIEPKELATFFKERRKELKEEAKKARTAKNKEKKQ